MLSLPSSDGHVLNHTRVYIETVILCPRLETLLPSLYQLPLSNLTTATSLSPNQTLSFSFKLLLLNISMWQSACDGLCPSFFFPRPPPASSMILLPGLACAGSSLHLLTNSQHHLCPLEPHLPSPRSTRAWTRRQWALLVICCLPHAHDMDA